MAWYTDFWRCHRTLSMMLFFIIITILTVDNCVFAQTGSCKDKPPGVRDGSVIVTGSDHGDTARFTCIPGWKLHGPEFVTCQHGTWTGRVPFCDPVYCPYPGTIANGQILLVGVIGKYEYRSYVRRVGQNEQIEYNCRRNYQRVGASGAVCMNGSWTEEKPTCVDEQDTNFDHEKCKIPVVIGGSISGSEPGLFVDSGTKLNFTCSSGYEKETDSELECVKGVWSFQPECEQMVQSRLLPSRGRASGYCPHPGELENGVMLVHKEMIQKYKIDQPAYIRPNTQIEFRCADTFDRIGSESATCVDGEWIPKQKPVCAPRKSTHGLASSSSISFHIPLYLIMSLLLVR